MTLFEAYITDLKNTPIAEVTEHSHRKSLQILLESIGKQSNTNARIVHEPRALGRFGRPDFLVKEVENIIGFVENKKLGEDLTETLQSDQIKKYSQLSDNILLTNYLDWVWIRNGKAERTVSLGSKLDLSNGKFKPNTDKITEVEGLIAHFFAVKSIGLATPKALAQSLAARGALLREELSAELQRQESYDQRGRLFGLYNTFRLGVANELTLPEFADAFSQMLVYGLFLAKLNADTKPVHLYDAKRYISDSFSLIQELVSFLDELERPNYANIKWIIEEVLTILNTIDLPEIQRQLNWSKSQAKDPYIYFYEDFLGAYDARLRKAKGVYYTPPAVVNFIVRAVNDILKDTFDTPDGLADREKVTVLDFATGTGTFLLEIMQQILERTSPLKREAVIKEHLLKNLYGFEYMIAAYTIAHLKLSQYLKENGYQFTDQDRVQVYLTNTLENRPYTQGNLMLPALSEESRKAQMVKEKQPILIITGNPPYSGHSKNNSDWIRERIKDYYFVDGKPLGERNPKWLQDDYVKFFRFAQYKMQQVEEGMVAIITNHSFLDNPTFRGMRQSLMQTFDQLYFLDLHGNAKKKEKVPTDYAFPLSLGGIKGGKDENVFDIEQGVAISIMIKKKGLKKVPFGDLGAVFIADLYGSREQKYAACFEAKYNEIEWRPIEPSSPFYVFKAQNENVKENYQKGWSVSDIFNIQNVGIVTAKDELLVNDNKQILTETIKQFGQAEDIRQVREEFDLPHTFDEKIKRTLSNLKKRPAQIKSIAYRPFDKRYIWWETDLIERAREKTMEQFDNPNIALITSRIIKNDSFQHVFAIDAISNGALLATNTASSSYVFPLYYYNGGNGNYQYLFADENGKKSNFTKEFKEFIVQQYPDSNLEAKAIFNYIYAILHSPTYRQKYLEFLKMDFPRIPFTEDLTVFEKLSHLGSELVETHLLKKIPDYKMGDIGGEKNFRVEKPSFQNGRLYFNSETYFDNVPQAVYEFQIGGYQVLDKYLKDRKGRNLSLDEIENVERVVKVLQFTIDQMAKIDQLTADWV